MAGVFSLTSATAALDAPSNKKENEQKSTDVNGINISYRKDVSVDVTGMKDLYNVSCTIKGQFTTTVEK